MSRKARRKTLPDTMTMAVDKTIEHRAENLRILCEVDRVVSCLKIHYWLWLSYDEMDRIYRYVRKHGRDAILAMDKLELEQVLSSLLD